MQETKKCEFVVDFRPRSLLSRHCLETELLYLKLKTNMLNHDDLIQLWLLSSEKTAVWGLEWAEPYR